MRQALTIAIGVAAAAISLAGGVSAATLDAMIPRYDHVIVIVEENKDLSLIHI